MKRKPAIVTAISIFVVVVVSGWLHRFWLFDSYQLLFYEPTSEISLLADKSGMSDYGRRLFYAAQPELLTEAEFDRECNFSEIGIVLGCYKGADIFILDVQEDELEPVESVTAAHEMLHVVYARISIDEERELERLLERQFELIDNQRILDTIDGYRDDPGADLYNEMHSIFGTEVAQLIPELETHYDEFFSDRGLVVAESNTYEAVFLELEAEIERYDTRLAELSAQIDTLETQTVALANRIDSERARLQLLLEQSLFEEYNDDVEAFNALVNTYNANVAEIERLVDAYNDVVAKRNQNVAAKNNLINSLDSNVQPIE